ncbi:MULTISPECIES: phage BR0599 family protein [Brevundimonas]|uniref:phage BR0599 family protein n=1 Tax=Brevundimonas TaxID=41275 RepID=UPI0028A12649|nr:phage BR0599 family protein [Brevundimonas vesicularis]
MDGCATRGWETRDARSRRRRVCDKRWETCVGTFENGSNFRGFPDVPGDDS